eukprot:TRINITY_DN4654_c0_g1_i1.p1 TRINITY_DN4654_c0_g1~~TRINITY_DN4654_c0_g1_i1.p1  ORF type:complete len:189 (+),score=43.24 TRINITY_DN4654_c0_g1_i1:33-569(+)
MRALVCGFLFPEIRQQNELFYFPKFGDSEVPYGPKCDSDSFTPEYLDIYGYVVVHNLKQQMEEINSFAAQNSEFKGRDWHSLLWYSTELQLDFEDGDSRTKDGTIVYYTQMNGEWISLHWGGIMKPTINKVNHKINPNFFVKETNPRIVAQLMTFLKKWFQKQNPPLTPDLAQFSWYY